MTMLDANLLSDIVSVQTIMKMVQIGLIGVMLVYLFFAFLLTRQVRLMNGSVSTPFAGIFRMVARIHFIAALIVTALALLTL